MPSDDDGISMMHDKLHAVDAISASTYPAYCDGLALHERYPAVLEPCLLLAARLSIYEARGSIKW